MAKKHIVGVMGPGEGASELAIGCAYLLGKLIAQQGWVLLTGGRKVGVMEAANQGAKAADGLTIGILPGVEGDQVSEAVDVPIFTGLGNARNQVNVLSSDVIVACGMGLGTASEVALALKQGKFVIFLDNNTNAFDFFAGFAPDRVIFVNNPAEALKNLINLLEFN